MNEAAQAPAAAVLLAEGRWRRGRTHAGRRILLLAAAAGQITIAAAWARGEIDALAMCLLQLGGSALVAEGLAVARRKVDASLLWDLLVLALMGPLGAATLLFVLPGSRYQPDGTRTIPSSDRTTGRADAVCAAIRQGRRLPPSLRESTTLPELLSGERDAQNAAIRAISRHYRPCMLPALMSALSSETPAVRVQAAAVFGKLRGTFGARARSLVAAGIAGTDRGEAAARAASCRETAASGFVDAATAETLLRMAEVLEALERAERRKEHRPGLIRRSSPPSAPGRPVRIAPPPRLKRHACGGVT